MATQNLENETVQYKKEFQRIQSIVESTYVRQTSVSILPSQGQKFYEHFFSKDESHLAKISFFLKKKVQKKTEKFSFRIFAEYKMTLQKCEKWKKSLQL